MIYGSNSKSGIGYLKFDFGRIIKLSQRDRYEFELWVKSRISATSLPSNSEQIAQTLIESGY